MYGALLKGYSTVDAANALLRVIFASRHRPLYVAWVPTDRQRADPLSRNEQLERFIPPWRPSFTRAKTFLRADASDVFS